MSHPNQPYNRPAEQLQPLGQPPAWPPAQVPNQPAGTAYQHGKPARQKRRVGLLAATALAAAVGLVSCGVGYAMGGAGSDTPAASSDTTADTAGQGAAPAAKTTTKAAAAKKWTTVITLKGAANKRSATFHLTGGQARLTYQLSGGSFATALIYVVDKGKQLDEDGGFPEVSVSEPGKDTTELAEDEGDYYLDVNAANTTWTITIQELR